MIKHRETKQRRLVLETVRNHTDHPTANTIYEEVHAIDGKVSQGTVYRNLSCLSEDGEILHIKVPGADRFDLRTDLHYHLLCVKCGSVTDIPFDYLTEPDKEVSALTGYEVFRHRTVFEGICPECRRKETAKNSRS